MSLKYMIILSIITLVNLIILYCIWILKDKKVLYEVNVVIYNQYKEIMLVYDQNKGRLGIPYTVLSFDEIPSTAIDRIMEDCNIGSSFDYSYSQLFHSITHKFDRIRDDLAPALIVDRYEKSMKKCCLYYVLEFSPQAHLPNRCIFPYSEFYSKKEIEDMDKETRPSDAQKNVINNVFKRIIQ